MPYHGGLDWGGAAHAVCVVDATGRVVARIEARHDAAGLADGVVQILETPKTKIPFSSELYRFLALPGIGIF